MGARNASALGLRMARALAEGLGRDGYCVVSGLARGIDAAAHGAAQPSGTVAVLAGGVDRIYPAENAPLADRILDTGLLLSEQPIGLEPQARHFPRRNRLISGLSLGVVVVEAAPRSGSLITVRDALEQGREVMAVPGHPFDGRAGGCNILLREGATLVRDAADVLATLGQKSPQSPRAKGPSPSPATRAAPHKAPSRAAPTAYPPQRSAPHPSPADPPAAQAVALSTRILDRLGPSPMAEDQLIRDLAVPAALLAQHLLLLELDGQVCRQPGGLLSRTG